MMAATVSRKLAPRFFASEPIVRAPQTVSLTLGTHQENAVFYWTVTPGCVVAPNGATTLMSNGSVGKIAPAPQQNPKPSPAKFVISGSKNMGSFSYYYYQLVDSNGNPLKGDGYSVEEHVVGTTPVNTSNNSFVPLNNEGIATDVVGWANYVNGVPQSITLPANLNTDQTFTQTFTVEYNGHDYTLSTEFEHEDIAVGGHAINTVIDVVP